jgi:hypothetical protein
MGYIRVLDAEVPSLPGLSSRYWLCFPRLPLPSAQGKRRGLRCHVPPGLPATWDRPIATKTSCLTGGFAP